jgi:hypothetical protein
MAATCAVTLDEENLPPQTPVGVNAEEGLTNSNENCQMQDIIWSQLPELNAIGKKEASEKFVGWEGQPTVQKHQKHNCEASGRLGARVGTWEDDVLLVG